jgi:hypothetical protein
VKNIKFAFRNIEKKYKKKADRYISRYDKHVDYENKPSGFLGYIRKIFLGR